MSAVNIIEIIISVILLMMLLILMIKKKKSRKLFIMMISINLLLVGHLTISNIGKEKRNSTLIETSASAQEIQDVTPPVIYLKGEKNITLNEGEKYQEQGYSAIDDKDGSVVQRVKVEKQYITDSQYKLIYIVRDKSGNLAREERIINQKKKEQPVKVADNKKIEKQKETQGQQKKRQQNTEKQKELEEKRKETKKMQGENKNHKGIIHLTFDDGPSTTSTPKILDILKQEDVKATFFILNYTADTEPLVKREIQEGHSVGIHGYSHEYSEIYKSEKAYMQNLDKLQNKIYQSTGVKTTITRFPGGSSNTISDFNPGIMTKLSKRIEKEGYQYCDWNVDSEDAGGAENANEVYKNVTRELVKGRRNVVLMHDFSSNEKTIKALKKIIEYGKKNGYTFEAITSNTPMIQHCINN